MLPIIAVKDDSPQSLFSQEEGDDVEFVQVIFTDILFKQNHMTTASSLGDWNMSLLVSQTPCKSLCYYRTGVSKQ